MASFVTHFNQFSCKNFSLNPPQPYLPTKPSIFHLTSRKHVEKSTFSFPTVVKCLAEQAFEDDLMVKVLPERERLKKVLISLFAGTDRGLKATTDARAHIVELVSQLEAENPNPQPTHALPLLSGKWILAYTSFNGLFPLLSSGTMVPFVKVEEISQTIDSQDFSVQNLVQFSLPLGTTSSVGTNAKFQVRSPKRVQIKFEEGVIGTPKLTNSIIIPEKIELFGQMIDLSNFKGIVNAVEETASSVIETMNSQSPFKFSISHGSAESWLLTSYLDEDLRISWADGGCLFILIKEGSSLSFLQQNSKISL